MQKIKIVIATRKSELEFLNETSIGKMIKYYQRSNIEFCIFVNNSTGLPVLYNKIINSTLTDPCILVFMHDDISLLDYYWPERIAEALNKYQIVGLAGNKRRVPFQPGWAFIDQNFTWDSLDNLSGTIGHGHDHPPKNLDFYGPSDQKVILLDGLFLAIKSETLINNNIYFDLNFDFHFYDMDICRQAESKNIICGTWPISVTHHSIGSFGSESWKIAYQKYINKWKS